ncbi:MAG: type IV toxin-antitoxin system AbiEi family antitoxin domain-containing protein [Actinomycetota bacterium]|nr:type IV toxin-antitoxin system AbiEi family antitoxin domain-containing protein [Actinomycetota bacterium]
MARRQHGYITRQQLLALGVGPRAIHYRVVTGRLIPVHLGVYAVGHLPTTPLARAAAAVLACGPAAALSHRSAAVLWKMLDSYSGPPEVMVPSLRRRPGIRVHRSGTLAPADVTTQDGIHITSPARTLLDIAPGLTDAALMRAVNDGRLAGYLQLGALAELLARSARVPGVARLERLVTGEAPTRSRFEDAFKRFATHYELPAPAVNVRFEGYEVDAWFPEERVIVELDGYRFHHDRGAFESDRYRDATLLAAGIQTVRITWERMTEAPDEAAALLHRILAARRR